MYILYIYIYVHMRERLHQCTLAIVHVLVRGAPPSTRNVGSMAMTSTTMASTKSTLAEAWPLQGRAQHILS